jgi:hypothetical protein
MSALSASLHRVAALFLFVVIASLLGQAQQESIIYNFSGGLDGSDPSAVIRPLLIGIEFFEV